MRKISYRQKNFEKALGVLYDRRAYSDIIEKSVKLIVDDVRDNGNGALKKYLKEIDRVSLPVSRFRVSEEEIKAASKAVDSEAKRAIKLAIANVSDFARRRLPSPWSYSPRPGVILGERFEPFSRVGLYIPGGTAPLVSTVIHTACLAAVAGVPEIVAVTPPGKRGAVHPAILYAMKKAGVTEAYRLGGAYGIAALAYGTKTIRRVEKIAGPGNAYVTAAKKLVYGDVAIDMVAGPSEIMIISDDSADPDVIAADMLSQAEHGSGLEQSVLVSSSARLIEMVSGCLEEQASRLSRSKTVGRVLKNGVFFIEVKDMDQAAEIAGRYAPEHLEIMCARPGSLAKQVKAAGAVFIGQWTPESVGDFVAGPSHVLPTGGSARYFSGLTAEGFFRRMSIVNYQKSALKNESEAIAKFAEMEGLDAHFRSAEARLKEN